MTEMLNPAPAEAEPPQEFLTPRVHNALTRFATMFVTTHGEPLLMTSVRTDYDVDYWRFDSALHPIDGESATVSNGVLTYDDKINMLASASSVSPGETFEFGTFVRREVKAEDMPYDIHPYNKFEITVAAFDETSDLSLRADVSRVGLPAWPLATIAVGFYMDHDDGYPAKQFFAKYLLLPPQKGDTSASLRIREVGEMDFFKTGLNYDPRFEAAIQALSAGEINSLRGNNLGEYDHAHVLRDLHNAELRNQANFYRVNGRFLNDTIGDNGADVLMRLIEAASMYGKDVEG